WNDVRAHRAGPVAAEDHYEAAVRRSDRGGHRRPQRRHGAGAGTGRRARDRLSCPRMEYRKKLDDIEARFEELERQMADPAVIGDAELRDMARDEVARLEPALERIERELKILLLPKDPNDEKNVVLEIRAGTGGDEATLFA